MFLSYLEENFNFFFKIVIREGWGWIEMRGKYVSRLVK